MSTFERKSLSWDWPPATASFVMPSRSSAETTITMVSTMPRIAKSPKQEAV